MTLRVACTQPTYLPWMGFFGLMDYSDKFVLLDDIQFSKRSWHHRNRVYDSHAGWVWLTIPTQSEFPTNINQVKVAGRGWIRSHYDRLRVLYKDAPYFDDVKRLFDMVGSIEGDKLTDYTIPLIQSIKDLLGIKSTLMRSSQLKHSADRKTDLLIRMTEEAGGDTYVAQPLSVEEYLAIARFGEHDIKLELFEYEHPVYKRENFMSHQSIVEMLCYVEPASRLELIRSGVHTKPLDSTNQP